MQYIFFPVLCLAAKTLSYLFGFIFALNSESAPLSPFVEHLVWAN